MFLDVLTEYSGKTHSAEAKCNDIPMNSYFNIKRKSDRYLMIAHISDLHTSSSGQRYFRQITHIFILKS